MTENKSHVLVVEDEPSFAEALTVGLEREGFRVTVAADGVAALERFGEVEPDLVLLDARDWRHLAYHFAGAVVHTVVRAGRVVHTRA